MNFQDYFKSVEYKGLLNSRDKKYKVKFFKADSDIVIDEKPVKKDEYVIKGIDNYYLVLSKKSFEELYSKPELLSNKWMWSEIKETVDGIINYQNKIVLIYRKYPPIGWALPGGMIDPGENAETAFKREMREELNLDLIDYTFFNEVVADEPRGPVRTYVYEANTTQLPVPGDDAVAMKLIHLRDLDSVSLAFEHHGEILRDYEDGYSRTS